MLKKNYKIKGDEEFMAKFCPSCGAEVKEGTVFCDKCGAEVDAENPTGQNQIQHTPQPEISRTPRSVNITINALDFFIFTPFLCQRFSKQRTKLSLLNLYPEFV